MILQRFQNELEADFAEYLEQVLGLRRGDGWEYEPEIVGAAKRPDFAIPRSAARPLLLDAKQFDPPSADAWRQETAGPRAFNPYAGARAKIDEGRRKFREFKGRFPCGVVLRSGALAEQCLDDPMMVFGSMLGSLGVQWPVDETGTAHPDRGGQAFLGGGRMIDGKRRTPQNTTLGALLVLRRVPAYGRALRMALARRPRDGRRSFEEIHAITLRVAEELHRRGVTERPPILGVRVHLNPFTSPPHQVAFPHEAFVGPVDEVWSYDVMHREVRLEFRGAELVRTDRVAMEVAQHMFGSAAPRSTGPV